MITRALFHSVGHSLAFKILLQTEDRASIMASLTALTNSMLSAPADFTIFSDYTAASTSSRTIGRGSSSGNLILGSQFPLDLPSSRKCIGLSSTLSIC